MKKILLSGLLMTLLIFYSTAQDSLTFSAYLDTYYAYDFAEPNNNNRQYVTQAARHNEFNINLAMVKASYSSEKIRGNIAFQTGTYPLYNYAEPTVLGQMLNEANVGINIGENSWIDVGIMGGHFGYESALTFNNELYTQALSTEYTPYYQTGIQYSNQLSETVMVRAVIVNGWQNIFETNDAKAFGTAIDLEATRSLSFSYGNYFGNEPAATGDEFRMHHNVYGHFEEGDLSATAILDLTFQNPDDLLTDPALFITLITSYQLNDQLSFNARYENVRDNNGILIANNFQSNILTGAVKYQIHPRAVLKTEARFFFGSEPIWNTNNGLQDNNQVISSGIAIKL